MSPSNGCPLKKRILEPTGALMELCVAKEDKEVGDQLIAACQRGDKAAFELLFEAYKDKVYSIAIHWLASLSRG